MVASVIHVQDIRARKKVPTVTPAVLVHQAAALLKRFELDFLPVYENGVPVGMITPGMIASQVVVEDRDPHATRIGDLKLDEAVYVYDKEHIESAETIMAANNLSQVLCVNSNRQPTGILYYADVQECMRELESRELLQSRIAMLTA